MKEPNRAASALSVTGIVALMLAGALFVLAQRFALSPLDVTTLEPDAIRDGAGLYFKDAMVLDQYAHARDNTQLTLYCALSFETAGGKKAVASLDVLPSGPLSDTITAYLNDSSAKPGDCKISFCATATALNAVLTDYLRQYVSQTFGSRAPEVVSVSLMWCGDSEEDYSARMSDERRFYAAGSLIAALAGGALLLAAFAIRRKKKKTENRKGEDTP